MDMALELLIPLTYIPGVALLIMSTSQRYSYVNSTIHEFSDEECRIQTERVKQEIRRAHLFRNSLLALYLSVAFFSLGSLVAFLVNAWGITTSTTVLEIATVVGVGCIVFAVSTLAAESILSLDIIKRHAKRHEDKNNDSR
ncbi:MAG: hypothetical protein DHS20C13_19860 [Thermodesulfobacteriota bacterium]|nr:MAG: hypothetical protein DHS20C13_19860 [Thermodesulfobacteriota bacterium]